MTDGMAAGPRVVGIGGVFVRAREAEGLRAWYAKHLGVEISDWGGQQFPWRAYDGEGNRFELWQPPNGS